MINIMIDPKEPLKRPRNIMIGAPSRANIMIGIMIDIMIGP